MYWSASSAIAGGRLKISDTDWSIDIVVERGFVDVVEGQEMTSPSGLI